MDIAIMYRSLKSVIFRARSISEVIWNYLIPLIFSLFFILHHVGLELSCVSRKIVEIKRTHRFYLTECQNYGSGERNLYKKKRYTLSARYTRVTRPTKCLRVRIAYLWSLDVNWPCKLTVPNWTRETNFCVTFYFMHFNRKGTIQLDMAYCLLSSRDWSWSFDSLVYVTYIRSTS